MERSLHTAPDALHPAGPPFPAGHGPAPPRSRPMTDVVGRGVAPLRQGMPPLTGTASPGALTPDVVARYVGTTQR